MRSRRPLFLLFLIIIVLLAGCTQPVAALPSPHRLISQSRPMGVPGSTVSPREDLMDPIVLKNALTNIDALERTLDWKPFRNGVEIARLYSTPEDGPSAAFLRYQPGASVPLHMHGSYEHILILRGTQLDHSGEHGAGTVIINPPGSSHQVSSPSGCIVLIIWAKPVIMTTPVATS